MNRQRENARAAAKFKVAAGLAYEGAATAFHGYEHLVCEHSKVVAIYAEGTPVQKARAGDDVVIVLDHTPFYAESGGQVGDTGELRNASSRVVVEDTVKVTASVHGHQGRVLEGELAVGDSFVARVNGEQRAKTVRNHSATHLMHKALREVLGTPRAAEGFTRERRAHALRLRPQRASDRRPGGADRGAGECRDPGQRRHAGACAPHRGSAEDRRDDAVRRKVRRRSACARHRQQP